jgi:multiple sugar transport system substrate-binding protein
LLSCQPNNSPIEITFGLNDSERENIQPLIDQFNQQNEGKIKVNWKTVSAVSDEFYQELEEEFKAQKNTIDVFGADVVWTATFAANEWVENLSPRFYQEYNTSDFVEPALKSTVYNFKVWGVPWYTDTGILFMRKDLLKAQGINQAPTTWKELKTMAQTVQKKSGIKHGYVFQGAAYEGGVANACEFIWNAGGSILLGDLFLPEGSASHDLPNVIITVDSKASEDGFKMARSLITDGVSPPEVVNYKESDAINTFANGDAVFMRAWPGNFSTFLREESKVKPDQVAVCPIPSMKANTPAYSCLGGWNLMINANSDTDKKDAAWAFIRFMTDSAQQKYRALNGGNLPTLRALYEDEEIIQNAKVVTLAKSALEHARSRPVTPLYMKISPQISQNFHQMLKGAVDPGYAVSVLQMELEGIEETVSMN